MYFKAALISFILFTCAAAQAAHHELVSSVYQGGSPYMVVHGDHKPGELAPGLYGRRGQNWELIKAGSVLFNPRQGPFVVQLSMTKQDQKVAAIAVVDGSIVMFNVDSDAKSPESFLVLGQGNAALTDIDTGRPAHLGPIDGLENIHVYQDEYLIDGQQLVLLSVRAPNQQPLTVAMVLKSSERGVEFASSPVVVDYSYRNVAQMAQLVDTSNRVGKASDFLVIAPLLNDQCLRATCRGYAQQGGFASEVIKEYLSKPENHSPVRYLMLEKRISVLKDHYPSVTQTFGLWKVKQTYQIDTGSAFVEFLPGTPNGYSNASKVSGSPDLILPGLLALHKDATPENPKFLLAKHFGSSRLSSNHENTIAAVIDGSIYLISGHQDSYRMVNLGTTRELFGEGLALGEGVFTDLAVRMFKNTQQGQHKVLLSGKHNPKSPGDNRGSSTLLFTVSELPNGNWVVSNKLKVFDKFLSEEALSARLGFDTKSKPIFDNSPSENVEDLKAYKESLDPYGSVVDISNSNDKIVETYRSAIRVIDLSPHVRFQQFRSTNRTGIYVGDSSLSLLGQLVKPAHSSENSYLLESPNFEIPYENFKAKPVVFALSSNLDPEKQQNSEYQLVLALDFKDNLLAPQPIIRQSSISSSLSTLTDLFIIPGRDTTEGDLWIIHQYVNPKDRSAKVLVTFYKGKQSGKESNTLTTRELVGRNSLFPELRKRFVFDTKGRLYWLADNKSPTSPAWTVVNVDSGQKSAPNSVIEGFEAEVKFDHKKMYLDAPDGPGENLRPRWELSKNPSAKDRAVNTATSFKDAENLLFKDLRVKFDELAGEVKTPKRLVFLVPEEVKQQAMNYLLGHHFAERPETDIGKGFYRADGFAIYRPWALHQEEVLEELEKINADNFNRVHGLIIADMGTMFSDWRPRASSHAKAYQISNRTFDTATGSQGGIGSVTSQAHLLPPSLMLLLDAGGAVSEEDYREGRTPSRAHMLFIASEDEWERAEEMSEVEKNWGLFDRYEIVRLDKLEPEAIAALFKQFFDRESVRQLGLKFEPTGLLGATGQGEFTQEQIAARIFTLAAARIINLSHQIGGRSLTENFIRYYDSFVRQFNSDPQIKQKKTVDYLFFERIMTDVFALPINLNALPPDDPFAIASDEDRYISGLETNGFRGSFEAKHALRDDPIRSIRGNSAIAVPGSRLIMSAPGLGKTTAFLAEIQTLGLKTYDFSLSAEERAKVADANAFYVSLGRLSDNRKDKSPSALNGDTVLNHLEHWLTLPSARRGFLYVDDLDKASDQLKRKFVELLRRIVDSKEGLDVTSPFTGESDRVSVRHMIIRVAMNPKAGSTAATIDEQIMEVMGVDQSFVDRFARRDPWDMSDTGGRRAELRRQYLSRGSETARDEQRVVLMTPELLASIDGVKDVDNRNFVGGAMNALNLISSQFVSRSRPLHILSLDNSANGKSLSPIPLPLSREQGAQKMVQEAIANSAQIHAVSESDWAGVLNFLNLNVQAFRLLVFHNLLEGLRGAEWMAKGEARIRELLIPSLLALRDHLEYHKSIAVDGLDLKPEEFGIRNPQDARVFLNLIRESAEKHPPLPFHFFEAAGLSANVGAALGLPDGAGRLSRSYVLNRAQNHLVEVLSSSLAKLLLLKDLKHFPSMDPWLQSLPTDEVDLTNLGRELAKTLQATARELESPNLLENTNLEKYKPLGVYETVRLYLVALDRAVAALPWGNVSSFYRRALEHAVQDQLLIQSINVQNYFFNQRKTLLYPATPSDLIEKIDGLPVLSQVTEDRRRIPNVTYKNNCESLLQTPEIAKIIGNRRGENP